MIQSASPIVDIIVFDPDGSAEKGDGYHVVDHLEDLKLAVQGRRWTQLRINIICPPEYNQWAQSVGGAAEEGRHIGEVYHFTTSTHSRRWTDHGLDLLPRLAGLSPLVSLEGAAEGCIGVVVGSGPSLNAALPMLVEHRENLVIVACDTAAPVLDAAGIIPDIVCAVEADPNSYKQSAGLSLWSKTIVAPGIHTHPDVWELPAGAIMPVVQPVGGFGRWFSRHSKIRGIVSGGSVGTLCYEVLCMLGCSTVVAVGMDCGYGKPGEVREYADGIDIRERDLTNKALGVQEVPGWGGENVMSHPLMMMYRDWLSDRPRQHPDVEHINCSVGGARLDGWTEVNPGPIAVEDAKPRPDLLTISKATAPIDMDWVIPELERQLEGSRRAESVAYAMLETQAAALECVPDLIALGGHAESELSRGRGVVPLNEWAWLPTPTHIRSAVSNTDRIVRNAREIRPLIERCIASLRGNNVRAA
jgi:hypothetical protein